MSSHKKRTDHTLSNISVPLPSRIIQEAKIVVDSVNNGISTLSLKRPETPAASRFYQSICESEFENSFIYRNEFSPKLPMPQKLPKLPRPPSNKSIKKLEQYQSRPYFKRQGSLPKLEPLGRTSSLITLKNIDEKSITTLQRRVFSGPKERISPLSSEEVKPTIPKESASSKLLAEAPATEYERGEGDGKEASPRDLSTRDLYTPINIGNKDLSVLTTSTYTTSHDHYSSVIEPILSQIKNLHSNGDNIAIKPMIETLYTTLKLYDELGKHCPYRSQLLSILFSIMDIDNSQVLLEICRIILALKVTSGNLLNVLKLIYKLSREELNDEIFLNLSIPDSLIQLCGNLDISFDSSSLIYCIGSIKCLSTSQVLCEEFCTQKLISHLSEMTKNTLTEKINLDMRSRKHLLIQILGALRNIAESEKFPEYYIRNGILSYVYEIFDKFSKESTLILISSRILSKCSMIPSCCLQVSKIPNNILILTNLTLIYTNHFDILTRLLYSLSNLMINSQSSRVEINDYIDKIIELSSRVMEEWNFKNENSRELDILIKYLTIITNFSIEEVNGIKLANRPSLMTIISKILSNYSSLLKNHKEILYISICVLNNVSFYGNDKSAITNFKSDLILDLTNLLLTSNLSPTNDELSSEDTLTESSNMTSLSDQGSAITVEILRVFSNLSRISKLAQLLIANSIVELSVTLLDSSILTIVFYAIGLLMNLMLQKDCHRIFGKEGGVEKLIDLLQDIRNSDWILSSMICQLLYNYTSHDKTFTLRELFGGDHKQIQQLRMMLNQLVDVRISNTDSCKKEYDNFADVAKKLLKSFDELVAEN